MTAALTTVAARLSQLIRLLGSDRDFEALAAVRAIGKTLASVNADFHVLADAIVERTAPAITHRECGDHRAMARWVLHCGARLSQKEWSFVSDMEKRLGSLSERQRAWLQAIFERSCAERRCA